MEESEGNTSIIRTPKRCRTKKNTQSHVVEANPSRDRHAYQKTRTNKYLETHNVEPTTSRGSKTQTQKLHQPSAQPTKRPTLLRTPPKRVLKTLETPVRAYVHSARSKERLLKIFKVTNEPPILQTKKKNKHTHRLLCTHKCTHTRGDPGYFDGKTWPL